MFTLHSVCLLPHPLSHSNILCVSLIHCILSSASFKPLHMLWTLFTNTYVAILLSSLPLFVSLSDWPSPAPNPSLTMQLWVPRRSPRIICYATMILNNTHRQYLLDTAEIKRKSYHGTKTNKKNPTKQHSALEQTAKHSRFSVHNPNQRWSIWYSSAAAEKQPEWIPWYYYKLLFLWMPASQRLLDSSVNSHFLLYSNSHKLSGEKWCTVCNTSLKSKQGWHISTQRCSLGRCLDEYYVLLLI